MLDVLQIVLAVILVTCIVMQAKGGGLGSAFGSTSYHTKRGAEKTIFYLTIVTAIIFVATAAINSLA